MKIRSLVTRLALIGMLALALPGASCPTPNPRPPGPDGSARWAYAIAQPLIAGFAGDVELREILGATIMLDGRLPANTGSWSFVAYSPSRAEISQVTVLWDGTTSTTQREEAAPGPGVVRPLPATWADSIDVFHATDGHRGAGASRAQLAVLNLNSYPQSPNQAVWGINFNAGHNQLVLWDGTYIGQQ